MSEDVTDLTDRDYVSSVLRGLVEDRGGGWRDGVVSAITGASEVFSRIADEGAGDHATNAITVDQFARDRAHLVQPLEAKCLFVRRDLEDAVGGCVADGLSAADVGLS